MISAILCGAGKGERAGFSQNKLLEELNGLPVLSHTLSALSRYPFDEILVTCSERDEKAFSTLLAPYPTARLVRGGKTRFESVLLALRKAKGELVLVHDGARPFVSLETVEKCVESAKEFGSGVCALPATDTTALTEDGYILSVPDRKTVYTLQTPQAFQTDKLLSAYEKANAKGGNFTDESSVFGAFVSPAKLVVGNRENVKLTYPEDFRPASRVGFGVDTHAFGKEQDFVVLAGVKVPSFSGLIAHSDGDVLVHALMDALLSGAGLRDIGYYFPDTDTKFKGADSMKLLEEVMMLLSANGLAPVNVSISVLAEKPRLSAYIEAMKENLSRALRLPTDRIGLGAGTNEKLGYVGEGKGITVYATALLKETKNG